MPNSRVPAPAPPPGAGTPSHLTRRPAARRCGPRPSLSRPPPARAEPQRGACPSPVPRAQPLLTKNCFLLLGYPSRMASSSSLAWRDGTVGAAAWGSRAAPRAGQRRRPASLPRPVAPPLPFASSSATPCGRAAARGRPAGGTVRANAAAAAGSARSQGPARCPGSTQSPPDSTRAHGAPAGPSRWATQPARGRDRRSGQVAVAARSRALRGGGSSGRFPRTPRESAPWQARPRLAQGLRGAARAHITPACRTRPGQPGAGSRGGGPGSMARLGPGSS